MPPLVRLPAEVPDGECRIYWSEQEDGGKPCLHVWGPRGFRNFVLDHFGGKRPEIVDDLGVQLNLRTSGVLVDRKSFVDELDEAGWDPASIVFSIRKKGFVEEKDGSPDDVPSHLDRAYEAIARLKSALKDADQAKGTLVFTEDEVFAIEEIADEAMAEIASAMEKARP